MEGNGQGQNSRQIPFGTIPQGTRIVAVPQFNPELVAALRHAREDSGGKFMVLVFTCADEPNQPGVNTVHMHASRGKEWKDDWFVRSYRMFVGEMLKFSPEMFAGMMPVAAAVARPAGEVVTPATSPDVEAVANHYNPEE